MTLADQSSGITVRIGDREFAISDHARQRMLERGVTLEDVEKTLSKVEAFDYFHEGRWKSGYYDQDSQIFVGVVEGLITTVIPGASPLYIANLREVSG